MNLRHTAPNIPNLRDRPGSPPEGRVPSSPHSSVARENAYIMRTKCAQKRICYIFNYSAADTYNFNAVKCTHFPERQRSASHPLFLGEGDRARDRLVSAFFPGYSGLTSELTKTDRFRPILPGEYYTNKRFYSSHRNVSPPAPSVLYASAPLRLCVESVPRKMGKNGTFLKTHKPEPLRHNHLRRRLVTLSHFPTFAASFFGGTSFASSVPWVWSFSPGPRRSSLVARHPACVPFVRIRAIRVLFCLHSFRSILV